MLGLLVLVVYASALGGGFVWTDREDLLQGAYRLHTPADLGAILSQTRPYYRAGVLGGGTAQPDVGSWQPLVALANTLGWSLWGDCAFCFHLENLLLHGLLVVGLYALGRRLLSRRRHGNRIAFWAAALFAVHPAAVSSVALIGGLPYLLAAVFSVWSLAMFSRLRASTRSHHGQERRWLAGLGAAGLAAMLTHETAYLLPVAALLVAAFDSIRRGRPALGGISPARRRGLAVLTAVLALVVAYRTLVLGGLGFSGSYPSDSVFDNVGTALRHFWFLVEQVALPGEPVLSDARPVSLGWGATEVAALLGALLLVGAVLLGLGLGHPSAFGLAWLLLWLLPGVGLFPTDHYHSSQTLYLASWGLVFAVTYALFLAWRPLGRQLMPGSEVVIYLPIIIVLGVISGFSNARFWDHRALFESEISTDPHYIEGRLELAKVALEDNEPGAAMHHVLEAIEASRDASYTGYWSAREAYLLLGRAQLDLELPHEALGSFQATLDRQPDDPVGRYWLGVALLATGEPKAAETNLRAALQGSPAQSPEAEADLGVALARQGRFVEARPLLATAIDRNLGNPRRHLSMAMTLLDGNELAGAARHLELALAEREVAEERARLAWIHWRLGNTEQAQSHINMALQLEETSSDYVLWVLGQINGTNTGEAGTSRQEGPL